jgi:2'-5' RNA ligase
LFVGVEVPAEARAVVAEAIEPLRREFPAARWAPEENWHVTIKFLGGTYPRLVTWLEAALRDAASGIPGFRTRIDGVGAFPSARHARVVWAGLDDGSGRLGGLALAIDAACAAEIRSETRPFHPHLTVARSDPPLELPETFEATPLRSEPFPVERIVLFRSHLRRPAPRYEALRVFELGE